MTPLDALAERLDKCAGFGYDERRAMDEATGMLKRLQAALVAYEDAIWPTAKKLFLAERHADALRDCGVWK